MSHIQLRLRTILHQNLSRSMNLNPQLPGFGLLYIKGHSIFAERQGLLASLPALIDRFREFPLLWIECLSI